MTNAERTKLRDAQDNAEKAWSRLLEVEEDLARTPFEVLAPKLQDMRIMLLALTRDLQVELDGGES